MRRLLLGLALLCLGATPGHADSIPPNALKYKRDLIRAARYVYGLDAPVAVFAAQIHQESAWRADAKSPFADGLAQFTPGTADWIKGAYPDELGQGDAFNPGWAMRALVRYDKHLGARIAAATPCEHWAFTLSAYNGGLGWVIRDKALAGKNGADSFTWFGAVEKYTTRAAWAKKENRGYPRNILLRWQPLYESWGGGINCKYVDSR